MPLELNPERRLLSCIMIRPEIMSTVMVLVKETDFVDKNLGRLFKAAKVLHGRGDAITVQAMVASAFPRGAGRREKVDLAHAIAEAHSHAGDWRLWVDRVITDSERRKLRAVRDATQLDDLSCALAKIMAAERSSKSRVDLARKAMWGRKP